MKQKLVFISIITALTITALYQFFAVGRFSYPEYRVTIGQVADFELIAPFDFPVLKSDELLKQERSAALAAMDIPYTISDQAQFDAYSVLDRLFAILQQHSGNLDEMSVALKDEGFNIDIGSLQNVGVNARQREKAYKEIKDAISKTYRKGIHGGITSDSILIKYDNRSQKRPLTDFLNIEAAKDFLGAAILDEPTRILCTAIASEIIVPSIVVDEELRKEMAQDVLSSISQVEGEVLQNEIIIRKNARITDSDINKLSSLTTAYRERDIGKSPWQQMWLTVGMLLFTLLIVFATNYYLIQQQQYENIGNSVAIPVNGGMVLMVILAIINNHVLGYPNLLIPFALAVLAVTILIGFEFGALYGLFSTFLLSPFINWETYTPVALLLSVLLALLAIRQQKAWHDFYAIGLMLFVSSMVVNLALSLYRNDPFLSTLRNLGYGLVTTIVSVSGAAFLVVYYEKRWNRATKQTLLELLDFNHPLLKKLAKTAVGTYHHSLVVGNLAERAAEAIGANPLLARVGSYYHDIGKVINTDIFTENNEDSNEIHDRLSPEESAGMIKNHVKEGIILAQKYHIPQAVIDIIMQHHGSSSIRYFLDQAEKSGDVTDWSNFSYPGPKPQTKEAAIVMLADIVESTTKAKQITSEQDIIKIIDDTAQRLIREGQLDESPITLRDINLIKSSMIPALESIFRKRLDYPEEKSVEQT